MISNPFQLTYRIPITHGYDIFWKLLMSQTVSRYWTNNTYILFTHEKKVIGEKNNIVGPPPISKIIYKIIIFPCFPSHRKYGENWDPYIFHGASQKCWRNDIFSLSILIIRSFEVNSCFQTCWKTNTIITKVHIIPELPK